MTERTRINRPFYLSEEEAFRWHMPGDPPPAPIEIGADGKLVWLQEGCCWDWTASLSSAGYGQLMMGKRVVRAHVVAHRIFNPSDPITAEKPLVLHWCDRKICCQPAHLHAGTKSDNAIEAIDRGLAPAGDQCAWATLTEADVRWIRQSDLSNAAISRTLGVAPSTVSAIRVGRSWKHLL